MKRFGLIVFLVLCVFSASYGQDRGKHYFNSLYHEIIEKSTLQNNLDDSLDYVWYSQLIKPFVYGVEIPSYYNKFLDLDTLDVNELKAQWKDKNIHDLREFVSYKKLTIRVDKFKINNMLDHDLFNILGADFVVLKEINWHEDFKKSAQLLIASADSAVIKKSKDYSKAISDVFVKYENKYTKGYRQRNIASFLVDGYIAGRRLKRMNKRNVEDNLLRDPSRLAITLISPPIIMVSTNSFNGFEEKADVFGALQLIGADIYIDKKFKHFIGVSAFHASPTNSDNGLWNGSYFGGEIHWNNKINLGIGRSYKKIEFNDGEKVVSWKLFFSYALFDKFFK